MNCSSKVLKNRTQSVWDYQKNAGSAGGWRFSYNNFIVSIVFDNLEQ